MNGVSTVNVCHQISCATLTRNEPDLVVALEGQDLPCTYLAQHELQSLLMTIIY